jgi:hypothetical protein
MKKILLLLISLLLIIVFVPGQVIEKKWFEKNDSVYGYYSVIKPKSQRIQAALILLDGYGGNSEDFLPETKIPNVAFVNDILTVCVPTGFRLYADKSIIDLLNRIMQEVKQEYHLKKDQFAIGGMSSGGTIALRYAELCNEKTDFPIQPRAVFAVDSPVDLIGLYKSSERELKKNYEGWWLGESQMIIDTFKKNIGEINNVENYNKISPFYTGSEITGNEKFLKDVAFRTYHDVDVNWHIQNRRRSIYETNMLNASELVSRLVLMGNSEAEFISSKLPGRRSNGVRHPHSWSIVDEVDLVQWIKEKLHFYPDHLAKPFVYNAPKGWGYETIVFPIDFAPQLSYNGFEELRFAPGWGDSGSNQKWGYTLLWWLNDRYEFNEKTIQQILEQYFTGLTHRRTIAEKLDLSKYTPAKAQVQKVKTSKGDLETYTASINIFDAQVTKKPGTLYAKIHLKDCSDATKTFLLFEVAGSTFGQPVWLDLDRINEDFRCAK